LATYPRGMRVRRSIAAAVALVAVYATVVRPRLLRSGATAAEVAGRYPGEDVVPGGTRGSTMAVTIDAPPRRVWAWLVQMGHGRAGWYSWDRLDNFGDRSADRIHDEWQDISIGDRLPSTPDGKHWFDVAALEPQRFLALSASYDVRGRQVASTGLRPPAYNQAVWCFLLKEQPNERTRLVVCVYTAGRSRPMQTLAKFAVWEPVHWVMQRRQFTNLKRRVEGDPATAATADLPPTVASHQRS